MQFNVLPELRHSIGAVSELEFEEQSVRVDDMGLHDLSGTASLLRTDRGLLVTLRAKAVASVRCSRCLADMEMPLEILFEEEFVPVVDANTGAPIRSALPADTFRIGPDFVLDLHEAVRQYILLSEPAKPLCRPDCRGICPNCGADLNRGACGCATEGDSRWQTLAGLKREIEGR